MQPKSPQQLEMKTEYFNSLLQRHSESLCQVQKVMESQNEKFQNRIQNGRYEIRESETAVNKKSTHYSADNTTSLKDMLQQKNNLERKLNQLQSNLEQLSTKEGPAPKVELTKQQHEDFMRQLVQSNKQLLAKKMERRQQEERRSRDREDEAKRAEERERAEREKRKKEELEEKLRQANELKQRKQRELDAQNRVLSSLMQTKPLYEKLEDNYAKFQLGSLEEKKKRLAEIRNLHKPITKEELDQHQKKFEALKEKRQLERQERYSSELEKDATAKLQEVYKSQWHKRILEQAKTEDSARKDEQDSHQIARQMRDKLKQYSQYVKANFKPQVDSEKAQQLKAADSQMIKRQVRPQEVRKMGLQYLKFSKQHTNPNKAMTELNSTNSNIGLPPKPINYLEQLRKKHPPEEHQSVTSQLQKLMNKPMQEKQKARVIVQHVAKLEQMAKRKEQLAKISGQPIDEELDQIYLDTAKAKLALLS